MSQRPVLRVRKSGTALVAAVIAFVSAVPLAGASWALTPVLLIPIAVFAWAWRAGTDVYSDRLRVRALFGGNVVPWSRVVELAPDQRGRVSALLDNGNVIRLTGITRENLPVVLEAVDNAPVAETAEDAAGAES
ncbi:PH domain-containing protein [Actinoplanes oblitus]|uniref:PH domain-containing protein n=1 Tax=Actinoplanes oblitus TaxID=3040509 RepID=A0ABY8WCL6_9ACTN|nr:PH domain-containing protein [Actinoplanes oblitus]WIM95545.1 PH domain-containing protein [Actinoplanes oblitus]